MELRELRKSKDLTQVEAASLLGVSLRSYKSYEIDKTKINTIKYKYFINELLKHNYVDEDHGILTPSFIKNTVTEVLKEYDVEFCYLFGSYSKGTATDISDVDLLISTSITGIKLFGLAEKLRESLCKRVDLLNIDQLTDNKQLIHEILKTAIKIYG